MRVRVPILALSCASGLAMPLAFAPYHWAWVAPLALQPILYATRYRTPLYAALCSCVFALVTNMAVSHWIYGAAVQFEGTVYIAIALIASTIKSVPYLLVGYLSAVVRRRWPSLWIPGTAILYVLAELSVTSGAEGFPFATVSLSQINSVQAAVVPLMGSLTVTFITLCVAALLNEAWPRRRALLFAVACLLGISFPFPMLHREPGAEGRSRVAVAQATSLPQLVAQTERRTSLSSIIIWPENSMLVNGPDQMTADLGLLRKLAASTNSTIVAGVSGNDGKMIANRVIATWPDGVQRTYIKQRLVPFAEYVPYREAFGALPILHSMSDLRHGDNSAHWTTSDRRLRFVPLICYEAAFPDVVRNVGPSEIGIVITDDSWFRDDSGPWQHIDAMRMAAMEYGTPLIVSGSAGPSGVITGQGEWFQKIPRGTDGSAIVSFNARHEPTLFARWKYYPLCAIWLIAVVVAAFSKRVVDRAPREARRASLQQHQPNT